MVGVAQLVELRIVTPAVVGSNPIAHPIFPVAAGLEDKRLRLAPWPVATAELTWC